MPPHDWRGLGNNFPCAICAVAGGATIIVLFLFMRRALQQTKAVTYSQLKVTLKMPANFWRSVFGGYYAAPLIELACVIRCHGFRSSLNDPSMAVFLINRVPVVELDQRTSRHQWMIFAPGRCWNPQPGRAPLRIGQGASVTSRVEGRRSVGLCRRNLI